MKIGICCMTTNNNNLNFWIEHHLNVIAIDLILLRIENNNFKNNYNQVKIIEYEIINDNYNSYYTQQLRQINFVNKCIDISKNYNLDFLLHIDDDELLTLNKKWFTIHHYLNSLIWFDETHLRIQNFEAVKNFTTRNETIFKQTFIFKDCSLEKCNSYSNGKSIANLNSNLECNGCHTFTGKSKIADKDDIIILHYDSLIYDKWKKKFNRLKNISLDIYNEIPFLFYKESINIMNKDEKDQYNYWVNKLIKCDYPINVLQKYKLLK